MDTGFSLLRSQPIPSLNLTVEEYTHRTGAKHYHLDIDHSENVFMVAFRTVPEDSTGVAHILEHTALCGSEKFPVRDPFFLMTRRSLNTFMNAFTTSDYTAYPFASQNKKDYFNLMEVYLDAVFFSTLDPLDFAQEGHRVEFETPGDSSSPLVYKGVVFNEMKGDCSAPMSMLYHGIQEVLYPDNTYHYNSGGDPAHIPDLTYDELKAFYETHYHPSNAVFMTFGNISAATQQERMASYALDRLPASSVPTIAVNPVTRYQQPVNRELCYPVDEEDLSGKTHIVLAWLLGRNTDLKMLLKCHLLSDALLDTSASPLRQALEKTELASAVSPMSGFEEDHMEMNFMCGVEGSDPQHAEAIEQLILDVLEEVAEQGIEESRLEAVLHQLELSQREIGGDGWPYGLQLIFACMSAAVHGGDPIGLLDLDDALSELREEIRDPAFIRHLVKDLLLDNRHRVRVVMKPQGDMGEQLIAAERGRLAELQAQLDDAGKSQVIDLASRLAERQAREEPVDLLPQVTIDDVPGNRQFPRVPSPGGGPVPMTACSAGTNGITYHQVIRPLPAMATPLAELLPIYSQLVTETGSAGRDYLDTQHLQHSQTGGISAFSSFRTSLEDTGQYDAYFTLSSRTLNPKAIDMSRLLMETAQTARFDELERLKELVQQLSLRRMNGVAGNGHQYAMSAAAASLRPVSAINDALSGIDGVQRLRSLARSLENKSALDSLSDQLAELHRTLNTNPSQLLLVGEENQLENLAGEISELWAEQNADEVSRFDYVPASAGGDRAFILTSQVNFCAQAFATIPESHDDAAALSILAGVLRNNFLHTEVREKGGAYGGGAGHDSTNGVFRFYSYRDPHINSTFDAFSRAVEWILTADISSGMLEEAILGVISSVDAPGSPAGELRQAFHHGLFGRTAAHREASRRRYLGVTQSDLKRVAETYLADSGRGTRAVVTSESRLAELDSAFSLTNLNEE